METAQYFDKATGKRIPGYEAWMRVKNSKVSYKERP